MHRFYVLQLLEKGGSYYVWTRWGRVGERGQYKNMGPMGLEKAIKDFEKKVTTWNLKAFSGAHL